jgi:hypothetical protein
MELHDLAAIVVQPFSIVQFIFRHCLKHRDLLSEGQDLKRGITPTAKENSECGKECEDRVDHELTLLTRRNVVVHGTGNVVRSC